jgi:hypothetical protein
MTADTKENTVRILKGQDPIQSLSCRLNWHRWTAWEYVSPSRVSTYIDGPSEHVRCYCADCGLIRIEPPFSKGFKR